jgi:hypothetical protein
VLDGYLLARPPRLEAVLVRLLRPVALLRDEAVRVDALRAAVVRLELVREDPLLFDVVVGVALASFFCAWSKSRAKALPS